MLKPPVCLQLLFTVSLFAVAASAESVARIDAPDLYKACKQVGANESVQDDAHRCLMYIQGFLDATGAAKAEPERSDFFKRALRTRAGSWTNQADTESPEPYCIPADTTLEDVAIKLAKTKPQAVDNTSARQLMVQVLKAHFPCS